MRVSTICLILIVILLAITGVVYFFGDIDGLKRYVGGFQPATTPTEAMERFRDSIQKRKYKWAANYTTKDYAEILTKSDADAVAIGGLIDKVREFMENKKLENDTTILLLNGLDPFPRNFKIQGDVKSIDDKHAMGAFAWDSLPVSGNNPISPQTLQLDGRMFQRALAPPPAALTNIKIVKEGEHWKLDIPTAGMADSVRYFLDHAKAYESELRTFQTYITNDRYDSPKAFEGELLKPLQKAAK